MSKSFFECPECGHPLSCVLTKDKRGRFTIEFFCEFGEAEFDFEIATGLTNRSIAKLEVGKAVKKEMVVTLLKRESEEEDISEY
jgi:transcription elongation factor Elf1